MEQLHTIYILMILNNHNFLAMCATTWLISNIHEKEGITIALHQRLCAITWHPLQSISTHFAQHFLKKPHPSRSHLNFLQWVTYCVHCFHSCFFPQGVYKFGFFPPRVSQLFPSTSLTFVWFEALFSFATSSIFEVSVAATLWAIYRTHADNSLVRGFI